MRICLIANIQMLIIDLLFFVVFDYYLKNEKNDEEDEKKNPQNINNL